MLNYVQQEAADPEAKDWYIWRTGCFVDPERIWSSMKYPKLDGDGYFRGMAMPPCMSSPLKIRARTRAKAIGIYKHALSLYREAKSAGWEPDAVVKELYGV